MRSLGQKCWELLAPEPGSLPNRLHVFFVLGRIGETKQGFCKVIQVVVKVAQSSQNLSCQIRWILQHEGASHCRSILSQTRFGNAAFAWHRLHKCQACRIAFIVLPASLQVEEDKLSKSPTDLHAKIWRQLGPTYPYLPWTRNPSEMHRRVSQQPSCQTIPMGQLGVLIHYLCCLAQLEPVTRERQPSAVQPWYLHCCTFKELNAFVQGWGLQSWVLNSCFEAVPTYQWS